MQLESERLILRDAVEEDVKPLQAYQCDSRYLEHYDDVPDAGHIVQLAIIWSREEPRDKYQLVVTLKSSGDVIGCAGLRATDGSGKCADVGIEIDPDYWRNGYASEALQCIESFARKQGFSELRAETRRSNERSRNLLATLGFIESEVIDQDAILVKALT